MIALKRTHTPLILTPGYVQTQTQKFINTGDNVWNITEVKESLLELSYNKCAYCECDLTEESKYLEVEHFEDKSSHPNKVLDWNNLLPSCKRCNGSKGTHDVNQAPIINPFKMDPRAHLLFHLYRFDDKTPIGRNTIDAIDLNNSTRAVLKRFEVGEALLKSLEVADERLEAFIQKNISQRRNRLLTIVEEILLLCQPEAIYSATCATIIHNSRTYQKLVNSMNAMDLWSSELENLHLISQNLVLDIK